MLNAPQMLSWVKIVYIYTTVYDYNTETSYRKWKLYILDTGKPVYEFADVFGFIWFDFGV